MLKFLKRIFFSKMMFFGWNLSSVNPLECVSMNNKECKVRPDVWMLIVTRLYFNLLVLKQVNEVVVVTISMMPKQNCVLLMLLKT